MANLNTLDANQKELATEIESCLRKMPSKEALKELFWSILEYDPSQQELSLDLLSKKNRERVNRLEVFGTRGPQKLLIVQFESESYMSNRIMSGLMRNIHSSIPYCIYLFTDQHQRSWRLGYNGKGEGWDAVVLRLDTTISNKQLIKTLLALIVGIPNITSMGGIARLDDLFGDRNVKNLAKQLDRDASGIIVNRNYHWWCDLASSSPLLSEIQERELLYELKKWWPENMRDSNIPPPNARPIWNRLILSNLRFVLWVIKKEFRVRTEQERMDVIQEGNLGLIIAVKKANTSYDNRFAAYAKHYIRRYIQNFFDSKLETVRIPMHRLKEMRMLKRAIIVLTGSLGREPSECEIATETMSSEQNVIDLMAVPTIRCEMDELENEFAEFLICKPNVKVGASARDVVSQFLSGLDERQQEVLKWYYGLGTENPLTLEDIGERLNLTRERVRQIKEKTLRILKKRATINRIRCSDVSEWSNA